MGGPKFYSSLIHQQCRQVVCAHHYQHIDFIIAAVLSTYWFIAFIFSLSFAVILKAGTTVIEMISCPLVVLKVQRLGLSSPAKILGGALPVRLTQ